ncbi:hypothetical protein EJB05_29510, partial [Eragrostis curvula]
MDAAEARRSDPQADAVPQPSAADDGQLPGSGASGHLLGNGPPPGFAAEAYPNGGFGGVPASAAAIAGLEWQEYGVDEPWKERRRHATPRRGRSGRNKWGEEAAAAPAAVVCAICLKKFAVGADLMVMPCAHRFHEACLTKWLALSRLCPCCRHALPSEKEEAAKQGNHQEIEGRATRRSIRARRGNVRLSGPEWDSGGEDDCE